MMYGLDWGMGGGGWLLMIIGVILVIAVAGTFLAGRPGADRPVAEDAASLLKARFARGEIAVAEYEQARRLLGI